jgi:hypothetical protein
VDNLPPTPRRRSPSAFSAATGPVYAAAPCVRSPFWGMPDELLAKSAKNESGARNRLPEPFVLEHQPVLVDGQLGLEIALCVAVAIRREPRVALADALDS